MRKTFSTVLVLILMLSITTGTALAVNLGNFNPAKDTTNIKRLDNGKYREVGGQFTGSAPVSANESKKSDRKVIKPANTDYHNGVIRGKNHKTKVIKGTKYGKKSEVYKRAKSYNKDYVDKLIFFKASSDPIVEYTGYKIFDEQLKKYVNITVRAELVGYKKKNDKRSAHNSTWGIEPFVAFGDSKRNGWFNGLPTILIGAMKTAHVKYTFYHAGTNKTYKIKQNVTYDDIDDMQAVSIHKNDSGGFTAMNIVSKEKTLKFGEKEKYYVVQSTLTHQNDNENNQRYWMSYNIDATGGTVDMLYTTPQLKTNNKGSLTKTPGPPSGKWAYFTARTFTKKIEMPTIKKPYKRVYDSNGSDDVYPTGNNKYGWHNKLTSSKQEFNYRIHQKIPGGMVYGSEIYFKSLVIKDTLDSCVKVNKASVKLLYNGKTTDVTNHFTISKSGDTWTATLKDTKAAHSAIYKPTESIVYLRLDSSIAKSEDEVANHTDLNTKTKHRIGDSKDVDISDIATVDISPSIGSKISNETNNGEVVKTRFEYTPRHDIIVTKAIQSELVKTGQKFRFNVQLNNGSSFEYTIRHSNGKVDTKSAVFKDGVDIDLVHGDTLTIKQVPQTVSYTIKENGTARYTPSFALTNPGNCLTGHSASGSAGLGAGLIAKGTITKASNSQPITYAFKNTETVKHHDVKVTKKVEGGSTTQNFSFKIALTGLVPNKAYATSAGSKTANASGNLTINFTLKAGANFYINDIPDDSKYQITETGVRDYKASYKVTENPKKVTGENGSGELHKGISTPNETLKHDNTDYNISYEVTNSKEDFNDLLINKVSSGTAKKASDTFPFTITFSNIPKDKTGVYRTIGAEIYTWNGKKNVIRSIASRTISGTSYTETFNLKAGEYISFTQILPGTKYSLTEEGNDYIASVKGTQRNARTNNSMKSYNKANTKDYTDLNVTETFGMNISTKTELTFSNKRDKWPTYNRLNVEKTATDASSTEFDFTATLTGLEKNKTYAMFSDKGTTRYTLVYVNGYLNVRGGLGTTGDPYTYVAGVPIKVTRADGETKTIYSSSSITGTGNLAAIQDWIDYKGGSYTAKWLGGALNSSITGKFTSFTSNASGTATVNFKMSDNVTVTVDGLPEKSTHVIREAASTYEPAYITKRGSVKVDQGNADARKALQTRRQTFNTGKETTDTVKYTNGKTSNMLKSSKRTSNASNDKFDFKANIKNLTKQWYMSMVPGTGTFEITMNDTGDIQIVAQNYSATLKDIPVKLIRPLDKAEKVVYTNEQGKIPKEEFISWLSKGQKGAYNFTLEWNGGTVNGTFNAK